MKRYVLCYTQTDNCLYWANITEPFESDKNIEELNIEIMLTSEQAYLSKQPTFNFCGLILSTSYFWEVDLFSNGELKPHYNQPTVQTLDDWFTERAP